MSKLRADTITIKSGNLMTPGPEAGDDDDDLKEVVAVFITTFSFSSLEI